MTRDAERFEEPDDELRDHEYPDEDVSDADDESDTVRCAECGADVYEDADRCPRCGRYLTPDVHPWSGRPLWWILLGLLGTVAVIWLLAHGLGP